MKMPTPGPFAVNGSELPLHDTFATLRSMWIERYKSTSNALAERLGVRPQSVAQWASGSDPTKRPPLWALVALADDLRFSLVLTGDGVEIAKRRKRKSA